MLRGKGTLRSRVSNFKAIFSLLRGKGRMQRCYSSSLTHTYFFAETSPTRTTNYKSSCTIMPGESPCSQETLSPRSGVEYIVVMRQQQISLLYLSGNYLELRSVSFLLFFCKVVLWGNSIVPRIFQTSHRGFS